MRTLATNKNTERVVLPLKEEIAAIEERKKVKVEVYFQNGSKDLFFIESFSTVESLKDQVIEKYDLGLELKNNFGFLEVCKKDNFIEETYVDDHVKILDVLSSWTNEYEFLCKKDHVEEMDISFQLEFKIKFAFEPTNDSHLVLQYFECLRNFQNNRYEISFDSFCKLLVLKFRILFGDSNPEKQSHIHQNFKHLIPKIDREKMDSTEYNQLINDTYNNYQNCKKDTLQCMTEFVSICKGFSLFGAELYPVQILQKDDDMTTKMYDLPKKLILAIRIDTVLICSEELKVLKQLPFSQVMKWGYNPEFFIILVNESYSDTPIKMSFKTKMGSDIVYQMNTLVDIKLGKKISSNVAIVNENVTRELYKDQFYKKVNTFKQTSISF